MGYLVYFATASYFLLMTDDNGRINWHDNAISLLGYFAMSMLFLFCPSLSLFAAVSGIVFLLPFISSFPSSFAVGYFAVLIFFAVAAFSTKKGNVSIAVVYTELRKEILQNIKSSI